ncbi:MAG: Ig-like domain-containing domain [Cyclobacteriaceae bacterium]|nr:Ig-like domain-containing domain [Cyclobacteriaceae bacterium]MDH4295293.1 Ig-like domain-containing domain [Cyclobacteriaceae bacterium]MDH5250119.1 Ig-like domain-containing domain [Cyclobacteriaceae bacterium]
MTLSKQLHWIIYPLFFLSCARQTAPTGGPKDTIPPILIKANPTNDQTNYKGSSLELTFNETLILNNPKEQIIIIPDIGKDFDAEAKKNKIVITFQKELTDNTTYSINFREAIQDITEKNPTQALKLAFSTGSYIDSLSIAGTVYDLLRSTEYKDATVGLYESDTFDIFQHKPKYFSKTDKTGNFIIGNLKPGDYYIYAMDDKNKNLTVESKSESYGYLSDKISLHTNIDTISIPLFKLDARPLNLTSARPSGKYFNIKTTKSLADYKVTSIANIPLITAYGEDKANIRIYNTFPDLDSLQIHLLAHDSINNSLDTTLYAKFTDRQLLPETFKTSYSDFRVIGPKGNISGKISYNKPLLSINYDSIYYQIDSTKRIAFTPSDLVIDTVMNTLILNKTFDKTMLLKQESTQPTEPNTQRVLNPDLTKIQQNRKPKSTKPVEHQLYIGKGSLISIEQDSSIVIKETLKPTTLETTGIISVRVQTNETHFLVQLLTRDYKVLATVANNNLTTFEDLDPKTYQIRLIIDTNKDAQWTPGNFYLKKEPEKIIFYRNEKKETTVNLKANWEIGPLLITN